MAGFQRGCLSLSTSSARMPSAKSPCAAQASAATYSMRNTSASERSRVCCCRAYASRAEPGEPASMVAAALASQGSA
ncbi:Uncharacterised protein [Bordetella pertussis]|nr:Uncharacterised protein [Bordetella pertussis]